MTLRCDHCSISFEESDLDKGERRCPKCLRKSTVRELADARTGPPRKPWVRATFALVLGILFLIPGAIVLPLEGQYLMVGERVRGRVISTDASRGSATTCDVRYAFELHGVRSVDVGSAIFGCPRGGIDLDVISGPPVRSRVAGLAVWVSRLGLFMITAVGFLMILVAAHLFFPDVGWIRDLAAVLGSKDARARVESERGRRKPRAF